MTVKETLVEGLREEGWGFIEACESVEHVIAEFMASLEKKTVIHTAFRTFVLRKKDPALNPGRSGCGSICGIPDCGICTDETVCSKYQRRKQ